MIERLLIQLPGLGMLFLVMFVGNCVKDGFSEGMGKSRLFMWLASGMLGVMGLMVVAILTINLCDVVVSPLVVLPTLVYVGLGLLGYKVSVW